MSTPVATAKKADASPREALEQAIQNNGGLLAAYLPPHVPRSRFMALAVRAVLNDPGLWDCSHNSVLRALGAAAASGLPIDGKMSSLIVRKSKNGKPTANWDPSYRGMVYMALESGHVTAVEAHAVFARDEFAVELGTSSGIVHRPYLRGDRGEVIAAYAVGTLKGGGLVREVLGRADLEKVRAMSPASEKGPWQSWPERMAMKSAMRRLLKRLPAADIGTLERARQHVLENDDPEGESFRASIDAPPATRLLKPEETTDLEARAMQAISEAGSLEDLSECWGGIRTEFRDAGADMPLAIEAKYFDRRETLKVTD